jgi:gas vesicle protein
MNKKANMAMGVGAGVLAAGAAAYLLFGPEGKKHRKQIQGWAVRMKGEMIEKFEEAKELTEPVYHRIVDEVADRYQKLKNVDQAELDELVTDIRKHWKAISSSSRATPKRLGRKKKAEKDK